MYRSISVTVKIIYIFLLLFLNNSFTGRASLLSCVPAFLQFASRKATNEIKVSPINIRYIILQFISLFTRLEAKIGETRAPIAKKLCPRFTTLSLFLTFPSNILIFALINTIPRSRPEMRYSI